MKVTAILKGLIDSSGHQPIQIRVANAGKRTFFPTQIKIDPALFDKGKVKSKHPKAKEYNDKLSTLIIQYQAQALNGFDKKLPKTNFFEFVEKVIPTLSRDHSTVRYYRSQLQKLREFNPSFHLHEIDKDFLNRYKAFLIARGNEGNTLWSAFKFLKTFIKKALSDELIMKSPFVNFETPTYKEPVRLYLTEEEVKKLDKFVSKEGCPAELVEAGTWFLIACYTGLRISDIKAFSKKNIIADRLVVRTQKTKEMVGIPVSPRLKKYFERVDYKPYAKTKETYNKTIKILAAVAGVEKKITSHTGRHTAAMMLMNAGVSQEVVAKILGHRDLRATATYAKVSNIRIDMELKKLK